MKLDKEQSTGKVTHHILTKFIGCVDEKPATKKEMKCNQNFQNFELPISEFQQKGTVEHCIFISPRSQYRHSYAVIPKLTLQLTAHMQNSPMFKAS